MKFEDIIKHPLKEKIDQMCFDDEPASKIANWVRNTIDEDSSIPIDKKINYYISENKISRYKKFLKQTAGEVVVKQMNNAVVVQQDTLERAKKVVIKDAERNIINLNTTFLNLFKEVEERLHKMIEQQEQTENPFGEKIIQGYLQELRNLLTTYAKVSGLESFYQKLGEQAGKVQTNVKLSEDLKEKLREWARDILAETDVEKIPAALDKLENILEASNGHREKATSD